MALLPSDPKQQQRLLIGALPLLLLFGYWYFFHGKRREEITQLESRLETLETRNGAARARAMSGGPELEQKLARYEEHIVLLEELVPRSEELPDLLHAMTLRAQENRVDLVRLTPGGAEPSPFYTLQTYEISVFGAYHDVGRFLTAVGSLPRIVTPIELTVTRRAQTPRDEGVQVQASFRIKTYVIPAPTA